MDNKNKRRLRGVYEFSKKYPTQRGTVYAIGESRRTKKREMRNRILLAIGAFISISVVLIAFFFCRNLSRRPIPEETKAEENPVVVSADSVGQLKAIFIENSVLGDEDKLNKKIDEAKKDGFNAVMLDFKDKDGAVLFSSDAEKLVGKNQITKGTLNECKLFIPNSEQQERICQYLDLLDRKLHKEEDYLENLRLLKQSLLQKLFI